MTKGTCWIVLGVLTAGGAVAALSAPWAASQGEGGKVLEKNLDTGLREAINYGATIFNTQGDYAGCYRVFEGALEASKPLLGNYPALQKKIDAGLADASLLPSMQERAHALRKVLQEIRDAINPSAVPAKVKWDAIADNKDKPAKKTPPPDPNMARVKGKVAVGGMPLTYGFVTFVSPAAQRFSANIQKDGVFVFPKGFPPGSYVVIVEDTTMPPAPGEIRLPIAAQYTSPTTSPLRFTAAKGESIFNLDLTAK